jgi:formylglycine-generating enzyme required for sulfatase activity
VDGPVITLQPVGGFQREGSAVKLNVGALGGPSLTYRWFRDGVFLSGVSGAQLSFSAWSKSQAGDYSVVASNVYGSVISAVVRMQTAVPPTITKFPPSRVYLTGESLTLQVAAAGLPAPDIQWKKDGVALSGQNSTTLLVSGEGVYTAEATNVGGIAIATAVVERSAEMTLVTGGALPTDSAVTVPAVKDFYMGKHEVTWGGWKEVREWAIANGYDLAGDGATYPQGGGDQLPVVNVSWYDAVKWCNARSEKEKKTPAYLVGGGVYRSGISVPVLDVFADGYRLPTDAEWEWAARGGKQSLNTKYSGSNQIDNVAWYANSLRVRQLVGTQPVGTRDANELGIFDMSGNVWEWCGDIVGSMRRVRGGGWSDTASYCTVGDRFSYSPAYSNTNFGFRVAMNSESVLVKGGILPLDLNPAGTTVNDFEIAKYEVTWSEWKSVRDWAVSNGYDLEGVGEANPNEAQGISPVVNVSLDQILKWCNARSEREKKAPVYFVGDLVYRTGSSETLDVDTTADGYRLPTSAEWEWAARGGEKTSGYVYSGSDDIDEVAWYSGSLIGGTPISSAMAVGLLVANELGVYDMSGNVREWCREDDPSRGVDWKLRGGGWKDSESSCALNFLLVEDPLQLDSVGFRVVRTPQTAQ